MELTEEQITAKLPDFRAAVEAKYKADFDSGTKYDPRDVERLRTDDAYAKCFIRSFWSEKVELKEAVDQVDIVFLFRKDIGINDLKEDSFPAELKEREFLYWKGVNNRGEKILHFKVLKHKKGQLVEEVKKYIAYVLDCHQKAAPGERMVLIFDFKGAGVTNMDLDVVKYIISCFSKYFPSLLSYILLYEMPFVLNTFWKIIQSWLSDEQKKKIILVKKKEITKYINEDELKEMML